MRFRRPFAALALAVGLASSASAAPFPFSGTFTLEIGELPTVTATGAGIGNFSGAGGAASIPAGVFSIVATEPISPPLLVINGYGVGAPGQGGLRNLGTNPLNPGTNKALTFGGITGTMGLTASAYLITGLGNPTSTTPSPTNLAAAIPLAIVGVGCGTMCFGDGLGGLVMGTIMANPYQLGMMTVMGALQGVPSTVMGTGFDNRTAGGRGVLQLVSPTVIALGALGSLASLATLRLEIVPEPATVLLVAAGLAGLGLMYSRHRTL